MNRSNETNTSIPKAIMLGIAIAAMVPVASNLDTLFGTVSTEVSEIIEQIDGHDAAAETEEENLEQELADLKDEIRELKTLLRGIEQ